MDFRHLTHIIDRLGLIVRPGFSGTLAVISVDICLDFKHLGPDSRHTVLVSGICL